MKIVRSKWLCCGFMITKHCRSASYKSYWAKIAGEKSRYFDASLGKKNSESIMKFSRQWVDPNSGGQNVTNFFVNLFTVSTSNLLLYSWATYCCILGLPTVVKKWLWIIIRYGGKNSGTDCEWQKWQKGVMLQKNSVHTITIVGQSYYWTFFFILQQTEYKHYKMYPRWQI